MRGGGLPCPALRGLESKYWYSSTLRWKYLALEKSYGQKRVFCTLLSPKPRRRRGPGGGGVATGEFAGGSNDPPEVNSIHQAMVEKVAHFGIFVKMRGFAKSGLVYSSQARRSIFHVESLYPRQTLDRSCQRPGYCKF